MFVCFLLKRPSIIFHSGGLIPKINRVASTSRTEVIWYFLYMNISLSFAVPDSSILLIMVYCQQIKWFSQFRFLRFQSRDGRGSLYGGAKAKICGAGQNSAKNNKFFSSRFSEKRIFANGVRVHPCSTAQKRQPKRLKVLTLKTSISFVQEKQCYLI